MRRLAILLSVASIAGCTQRIGQLTLMSTKNLAATPKVVQQQVTGEDCVNQILGIPIGSLNPTLDQAIDNALEKVPGGDAMTNLQIHQDILFLYLYNRICMRVDGTVVSYGR